MIVKAACPCGARCVVMSAPDHHRTALLFAARLVAVAHEWAVDVATTNSNVIGGVCSVCRTKGAMREEVMR